MRHLVALLPLLVACSSDPAVTPSDASAVDSNVTDVASSDAAAGSCPEGERACLAPAGTTDTCLTTNSAGVLTSYESVLSCVTDARMPPCALPPPCGACARGGRLWRRADLAAHNAARTTSGMCPDYGDAGVPVATIRE